MYGLPTLTTSRAEREEDNIRYIRLGFPISSTITWDGNAFNTLGEEETSTYDNFLRSSCDQHFFI